MYDMPRTEEGGLQHITYLVENRQQLWDDTLMMTVLPLTKIGLVLGRPEYIEEAKRQFLLHIKYLADLRTGLWFHGTSSNAVSTYTYLYHAVIQVGRSMAVTTSGRPCGGEETAGSQSPSQTSSSC